MERNLQKSAIYGFLLTLGLAILFVDYKETYSNGSSVVTTYVPVYDYVISLLRYSVVGSFIGLVVGWWHQKSKVKKEGKSYYLEVFVAVFVLAIAASLLFSMLGI
ncbi:hypothetical protein [Alteribacter populi]|uniref:hypothetical protein n=1 Tax=Alteribacter populi TaxID=2011011 RepID=UPI0018E234BB|nr:hypothetical protein [Alteribacter populi]